MANKNTIDAMDIGWHKQTYIEKIKSLVPKYGCRVRFEFVEYIGNLTFIHGSGSVNYSDVEPLDRLCPDTLDGMPIESLISIAEQLERNPPVTASA